MIQENLEDAGGIIDNIFAQPLTIPSTKSDINLLKAAEQFNAAHYKSSELRQILLSFLQFPDSTRMMLRELEILQEELST
jgi:hypothetical protein